MSSRTETFPGAGAVDVTTTADPISIDTTGTGPIVVTLVPEVPGDQAALDRIRRAEVRAGLTGPPLSLTATDTHTDDHRGGAGEARPGIPTDPLDQDRTGDH